MIDPETKRQLQERAERFERMRLEALGMLFQAVRTIIDLGEKRFGPASASVFSTAKSIDNVDRANRIIMRLLGHELGRPPRHPVTPVLHRISAPGRR